ncbi:MAG: polymerase subunit gamma/tau [Firmicutes bacterium]|nr:polymerase subunit gamma/tau [Bacillota bacterium]
MSYTALYREWRPSTFDDVVGQKHITVTLKNQILKNRIAHAYLFCGTRGTGKTSTAKILAKAVNCLDIQNGEPCNKCEMCRKINAGILIDVIEMDAASKRKLEDIKDIIENVKYPPQEGRYKVYIMDEVHMLTAEAVNAFLKTLEEPPGNVIFILATTDPQKLPVTILSRCQKFDFRRIKSSEIFDRLRRIVDEQGILADDKSLHLIGRMSDGAMRDALSILDQAISMGEGKVQYENVLDMLGLVTNENLIRLTDAIIGRDIDRSMKVVDEVVYSGRDIYNFIRDMISHMRNLLVVKVSQNATDILDMSDENIELLSDQASNIRIEEIMRNIRILQDTEEQTKWIKQSRIYLELAVIKMCKIEYDTSKEVVLARLNRLEESYRQGEVKVSCERIIEREQAPAAESKAAVQPRAKKEESIRPVMDENMESSLTMDSVRKKWRDILEAFKARRMMVLFAALTTGEVTDCTNGVITIKYEPSYRFNKERLEKEDNRKAVNSLFSEVLGEQVSVRYRIDEDRSDVSKEDLIKQAFGEDFVEIIEE